MKKPETLKEWTSLLGQLYRVQKPWRNIPPDPTGEFSMRRTRNLLNIYKVEDYLTANGVCLLEVQRENLIHL